MVPRRADHPGRRRLDDRKVLSGILFVLYTGIPWEFLPQEPGFGSGMTCCRRLRDWHEVGCGCCCWPSCMRPGAGLAQGGDADLVEAAAWLHDIGYAPGLAVTGLHALDGARYLRDAQHADAMLCRLVAHHSCAIVGAGERGLADVLGPEFEPAPHVLSDALTFCDMTTSPDGELVPVDRRLAEIHHPHGPGHLVSRVNPARHAYDPPRRRAGPGPGRPNRSGPRTRRRGKPAEP